MSNHLYHFLAPGCTDKLEYEVSVLFSFTSGVSLAASLLLLGRICVRKWQERQSSQAHHRGRVSLTTLPPHGAALRSLMEYLVSNGGRLMSNIYQTRTKL